MVTAAQQVSADRLESNRGEGRGTGPGPALGSTLSLVLGLGLEASIEASSLQRGLILLTPPCRVPRTCFSVTLLPLESATEPTVGTQQVNVDSDDHASL